MDQGSKSNVHCMLYLSNYVVFITVFQSRGREGVVLPLDQMPL